METPEKKISSLDKMDGGILNTLLSLVKSGVDIAKRFVGFESKPKIDEEELKQKLKEREDRQKRLMFAPDDEEPTQTENIPMPEVPEFSGGKVSEIIVVRFEFQISAETLTKTLRFPFTDKLDNLKQEIETRIQQYLQSINQPTELLNVDVERIQVGEAKTDTLLNNKMRYENFNLKANIFSNIIDIKPSNENCVRAYLKTKYSKLNEQKGKPIDKLGDENGVSINELLEFCKKYRIRTIAYDIHRNVLAKYTPDKRNTKFPDLIYVYYQNHIYPINKTKAMEKYPKPTKLKNYKYDELKEKFDELLSQHILPADIIMNGGTIFSFIHDDTIHFTNDEFDDCYNVLKAFGIEDKIKSTTKHTNIMSIIEKHYSDDNLNSYLPINNKKPPFWYNAKNIDKTRETITIDKNKAYSSLLQGLDFLLSVDYRTTPITDDKRVSKTSLYIVEPQKRNILMPCTNVYTGELVQYCKGKFPFKITESIKCKKHINIYKDIVLHMFEMCDASIVKKIINKSIGMFQNENYIQELVKGIVVDDENTTGNYIKYGDYNLQQQPEKFVKSVYNRKPIAIQIKDKMSILLYEKMEELGITMDDIVQMNTDSITFYAKPVELKLSADLKGWKKGEHTEKHGSIYDTHEEFKTFRVNTINDNLIAEGCAGCGKSTYIKNNLAKGYDYIILSSKYSAIRQHRERDFNADVIQRYELGQIIPKENHIIIDEVGLLMKAHWDFLIKCFLLGKKISALGDFKQLLPVNEKAPFNSKNFLDMFFNHQIKLPNNYRNHFTKTYYNALLTNTPEENIKELMKYTTKTPEEAEVIIAYRREIVDQYNEYMVQYHKKNVEYVEPKPKKSKNTEREIKKKLKEADKDVPVICIDNELAEKGIFNNFLLNRDEVEDEDLPHFKLAYARTLYNLQGDEVRSFYIAPEDLHWFVGNREAYTLISRLRTK